LFFYSNHDELAEAATSYR